MRFSIYQDSLLGARPSNQDRMGYCFTPSCLLMVVADGMGGHQHGELAAHVTLETFASRFHARAKPVLPKPVDFLRAAARSAHDRLLDYQDAHLLPEAPRTTLVACVVQEGQVWWVHLGDSRLYWFRGAQLMTRTRDHSRVQQLIDSGIVNPEEAALHPDRNRVLNCLGSASDPIFEVSGPSPLEDGDTLFLCTDGVWGMMSEEELAKCLAGVPAHAVKQVVAQAVERGGAQADNATGVAMTWSAEGRYESAALPEQAMATTLDFSNFSVSPLLQKKEGRVGFTDAQALKGLGSGAEIASEIERAIQEVSLIREIRAAMKQAMMG